MVTATQERRSKEQLAERYDELLGKLEALVGKTGTLEHEEQKDFDGITAELDRIAALQKSRERSSADWSTDNKRANDPFGGKPPHIDAKPDRSMGKSNACRK